MPSIIIYTSPTCHFCGEAKSFLKKRDVKFVEHDVIKDVDKRKEMVAKSGKLVVPTIVIGDKVLVGFDEDQIKAALP